MTLGSCFTFCPSLRGGSYRRGAGYFWVRAAGSESEQQRPQPPVPSAGVSVGRMTAGNKENVRLFDAGAKGRGLKASKEFSTGEVVFAEPSYSAVVFDR